MKVVKLLEEACEFNGTGEEWRVWLRLKTPSRRVSIGE